MSKDQSDSDLLPYREVDRALKSKLPLLAGAMSASQPPEMQPVTTQHALGSLLEFWDLCADPRDLERIAAAALREKKTPELVLTGTEITRLFRMASGKTLEPVDLVVLRFLEPREGDTYRVRGMSRDFKPVLKRLRNREIAAAGGRASAESRKAATGSAQPVGGKGFKSRSEAGSTDAPPNPSPEPKRNRTDDRSGSEPGTEAEPKSSGQRSAISDTSSSYEDDGAADAPPTLGERFFDWFQDRRFLAFGFVREKRPSREHLGQFLSDAAQALEDSYEGATEGLKVAWGGYSQDKFWIPKSLPWSGFVEQWHRHVRTRGPRIDRSESQDGAPA